MINLVKTLMVAAACLCVIANTGHAQASEDDKLEAFFKSYLEELCHQQPSSATSLGDHRFDAQLDDISPAARTKWHAWLQHSLVLLPQEVSYQRLSRDGQINFEILKKEFERQLWYDDNLLSFEKDPGAYGTYLYDSVYELVARSTQPKESNIANAIARMSQLPRIVEEAKRSLVRPSRALLQTAIRQNAGAISFYEQDIFQFTGETPQQEELNAATAEAAAVLKDYQQFLEGPLRARASDAWRLGKEKFAEKFELETDAGFTAEQNFADAQTEFSLVLNELYTVARQLWPRYFPHRNLPADDPAGRREVVTKIVGAVNQDHGDAKDLMAKAQDDVEKIKDFIRGHDYLRLPEPDRCAVVEMPEFRRGIVPAYLDAAPPLDPTAANFFAISPPPKDWTAEQARGFLEEYNDYTLKVLTVHEAYPGHYVQFAYARQNPSLIRRVLASLPFSEGWAVYGEVTMLNEGFGEGDLRLRLMQLKFYLRAVTNSILDYKMHCTEMTDAEAVAFLTQEAFQAEGEAKFKVIRAKQGAVQLSTYFVGRMAHYRLRQLIEREQGDKFNLRRYHEAVLSMGSVPPKYMTELVHLRLAQP